MISNFIKFYKSFQYEINFKNGLYLLFSYNYYKDDKIRKLYKLTIFSKRIKSEDTKYRNRRFRNRNVIVKLRPKLVLFSIEHWETNNNSRKKALLIKTKSSIKIEVTPPGILETIPRSWD